MKKSILFKALACAFVCGLSFAACSSDDDQQDYPKTIRKQVDSNYLEFKVYVGSSEGGRELTDTKGLFERVKKQIEILSDDKDIDKYITFKNDNEALFHMEDGDGVTLPYKFENGELMAWEPKVNDWDETSFFGDKNILKTKKAYYKYVKTSFSQEGISSDLLTLEEVLNRNQLDNLSQLANEKDTIMWCNYEEIYK